jgi:hypothetical protein
LLFLEERVNVSLASRNTKDGLVVGFSLCWYETRFMVVAGWMLG